jgi:hypothetical protein
MDDLRLALVAAHQAPQTATERTPFQRMLPRIIGWIDSVKRGAAEGPPIRLYVAALLSDNVSSTRLQSRSGSRSPVFASSIILVATMSVNTSSLSLSCSALHVL